MVGICCHSAGLWSLVLELSCVPVPDYFLCLSGTSTHWTLCFQLAQSYNICLNVFEWISVFGQFFRLNDSMTHCVQNGIHILQLISMFNIVCMCVVWMLSGHTTVHLSCWHCHVTYAVGCVATLPSPPLLWLHWIVSCFPINAVISRNIHTVINVFSSAAHQLFIGHLFLLPFLVLDFRLTEKKKYIYIPFVTLILRCT